MNRFGRKVWAEAVAIVLASALVAVGCAQGADGVAQSAPPVPDARVRIEEMTPGRTFDLAGRNVTVLISDIIPYVENEIARAYVFDRYGNPKLERLRVENNLDAVVAPGRHEFQKQLLLMEWVNAQIHYGDPKKLGKLRNALEILRLSRRGQKLYCAQFAALLVSASASLGWVCRPIDIPTHTYTEMWSNQYRKWMMFDPNMDFYVDLRGEPLNSHEVLVQWFDNHGKDYTLRHGMDRREARVRRSFEKYYILEYIPNTDWLDTPLSSARSFYGTGPWTRGRGSKRNLLTDGAVDPYFPINQAALSLTPDGSNLAVTLRTLTPNFKTFRVRLDGGPWMDSPEAFTWTLHGGQNTLEAKSVNLFGVDGPVSTVELHVAEAGTAVSVVIPAVAFSGQGGGTVTLRDREGDVSPGYVHRWFTKGHWLEWTVDAAEAGRYDVALRYSTLFEPRRELRVNGKPADGLEAFRLGPTRRWDVFSRARLPARVTLAKGRNVVRLTCLDEISLCLSELCFSAPGKPDVIIDATDLAGEGGGKVQTILSPRGGYFRQWDAKDHWLEWTLNAMPPGRYDVFLRYATMYESPRRLEVNGQAVPGLEAFVMPLSGGWTNWVEGKLPAPVTLAEGRNVLRMTSVGGMGLNMTAIRLVGPDGKSRLVNATGFSDQGGGRVRVWAPSRHGSFYGWGGQGHWLEWTVPEARAGDYDVTLRYATQERGPREMQVNGQIVKGLEGFTLEPTGSWQRWRETALDVRVRLKAGRNVLRLTSLGRGGVNLDEIRLSAPGQP